MTVDESCVAPGAMPDRRRLTLIFSLSASVGERDWGEVSQQSKDEDEKR